MGDPPKVNAPTRDAQCLEARRCMPEKMVRDGLHDLFTPEKLVRFRGHSRFPFQRQAQTETAEVDGQTKYVVARIWLQMGSPVFVPCERRGGVCPPFPQEEKVKVKLFHCPSRKKIKN